MARTKLVVDDYGWQSAEPTCAHEYLLPVVLDVLERLGARRVLDLGCGNGAVTHALAAAGHEAVGCDVDEKGLEIARRGGGRFHLAGVYDDPAELDLGSFDAVVALEVVEHLFAPRALPRFARAVLDGGGHLVVSTPYHGYWKNLALSLLGAWDRHLDPLWDGGHVKLFSRATLSRLLAEEGFEVVEFHGAGRLPLLWKSMVLVARQRAHGLRHR